MHRSGLKSRLAALQADKDIQEHLRDALRSLERARGSVAATQHASRKAQRSGDTMAREGLAQKRGRQASTKINAAMGLLASVQYLYPGNGMDVDLLPEEMQAERSRQSRKARDEAKKVKDAKKQQA